MIKKKFGIADALVNLRPESSWSLSDDVYSGINWMDKVNPIPTEEEIQIEIQRLQAEWDAAEYQKLRAEEYPDFRDYLDGIVKGDQSQIDKYIADCLAVKEKYPKPL